MAKYQRSKRTTFINPYTFIPLSDEAPNRENGEAFYEDHEKELISGFLQCQIEVKTPLAIPDVSEPSNDNHHNPEDEHASYRFFDLNGKYTIPGSSIRGAIRSVHETMTNSCYATADPKERISIRVEPKDYYNPCLLIQEEGLWRLYKAETYAVRYKKSKKRKIKEKDAKKHEWHIDGIYYGDEVSFSTEGKKVTEMSGNQSLPLSGYMYIGEDFSNKYSERIFVKGDQINKPQCEIDSAIEGLAQSLKSYRNKAINKNFDGRTHLGYRGFERALKNGAAPVWYKYEKIDGKEHLFLSMACLGRKQFLKSNAELLEKHLPCNTREDLCPSCLLFGMVGDKSLGSRIRVTDACLTEDCGAEWITLKELGAPRPSYVPFYTKNGITYDGKNGGIRGRKYYWHNSTAENDDLPYKSDEKTKRNSTMELIRPGAAFDFKIYFDQITQAQLDTLMAAVTLGKDTKYCHKLGHGKPLGLGSIKIKIKQLVKREYQNGSYQINQQHDPEISAALSKELQAVLSYPVALDNTIPISYPWIGMTDDCRKKLGKSSLKENVLASHKWFYEFKKSKEVLPALFSEKSDSKILPQPLFAYELKNFDEKDLNSKAKRDGKSGSSSGYGKSGFEENKEYSGTVKRYKKENNVAVIILNNKEEATIHFSRIPEAKRGKIDQQLPIKQKVTIKYPGKNNNGYDDWSFVKYN